MNTSMDTSILPSFLINNNDISVDHSIQPYNPNINTNTTDALIDPNTTQVTMNPSESLSNFLQSLSSIALASNTSDIDTENAMAIESSSSSSAFSSSNQGIGRGLSYLEGHLSVYSSRVQQLHDYASEPRYTRYYLHDPLAGSAFTPSLVQFQKQLAATIAERNTWLLLYHLRRCTDIFPSSSTTATNSSTPSSTTASATPFSHASIVKSAMNSKYELARMQSIVDWLEEINEEDAVYEEGGNASFQRTLQSLQKSAAPQQGFDPDGESRMEKGIERTTITINSLDKEDEARLLSYIWRFLRAGRLSEAIGLCRQFGQYWRAASLNGGRFYDNQQRLFDDDGKGPYSLADSSIPVNGNRNRFLWKESCIRLATNGRSSPCESAIYALLGGYLPSVLSFVDSYTDALWAYFKQCVHHHLDQEIVDRFTGETSLVKSLHDQYRRYESKLNTLHLRQSFHPALSAQAIFEQFDSKHSIVSEKVRMQSYEIYHSIQRALILQDYTGLEQLIERHICHLYPHYASLFTDQASSSTPSNPVDDSTNSINVNHNFLFFAAHLYLYLHPTITPHSETLRSSYSIAIFSALIRQLIRLKLYPLIAVYAAYLPSPIQVREYVGFLNTLTDVEERKHYLQIAKQFFPHSLLAITKGHIETIQQQTDDGKPALTSSIDQRTGATVDAGTNSGIISSGSSIAIDLQLTELDVSKIRALECFELYRRIAKEVLFSAESDERATLSKDERKDESGAADVYTQLREVLYKLVTELQSIDPNSNNTNEFERLLFITHLCAMKNQSQRLDLKQITAKSAMSLLRYTADIPVDKAFFDAGHACKEQGWLSNAFVFWNRYVDVTDKLKEPDSGDIDNADFLNTDIPAPDNVPTPPQPSYGEDMQEEAREWVLEKAMSNEVGQSLQTRPCEKCGKEIYEASLKCYSCKTTYDACCVTGFPIDKKKGKVQCKTCNKQANKEDWNKYVAKTKCCPWCAAASTPVY